MTDFVNPVVDFAIGIVSHRTCIEHDDICVGFVGGNSIRVLGENGFDELGVVLIHLASVGFDKDFFHRGSQHLCFRVAILTDFVLFDKCRVCNHFLG